MKTLHIEKEDIMPQKLKGKKSNPKIDQKFIAKVGSLIYHQKGIKGVRIRIDYKNGMSTCFIRDEDEDRRDRARERYDKEEEDDD